MAAFRGPGMVGEESLIAAKPRDAKGYGVLGMFAGRFYRRPE
jgi:hypothetical protein